jgi:hypothetical protein
MTNTLNGHRPLIISTSISLVAIITMTFYLGAKTQTLKDVQDNQATVLLKLDNLQSEQVKRDLWTQKLDDRMTAMHDAITDIQVTLKEGKRR